MSIKTIQEKLKKAREKAKAKSIKKAELSLKSTEDFIKSSGIKNKRLLNIAKRKRQSIKELRDIK